MDGWMDGGVPSDFCESLNFSFSQYFLKLLRITIEMCIFKTFYLTLSRVGVLL